MRQFEIHRGRHSVSEPMDISVLLAVTDFSATEIEAVMELEVDQQMSLDESVIVRIEDKADAPAKKWFVKWQTCSQTGVLAGFELNHSVSFPNEKLANEAARRFCSQEAGAGKQVDIFGDEYEVVGGYSVTQE